LEYLSSDATHPNNQGRSELSKLLLESALPAVAYVDGSNPEFMEEPSWARSVFRHLGRLSESAALKAEQRKRPEFVSSQTKE